MFKPIARASFLAPAAMVMALALPASAHHSTAMFEWGKEVPISGTVERFDWTNPHTFLYMMVPDGKGGSARWAFEGMSPNHLSRHGWSKRTLNPGDKITVGYYPLKDGRKGGFCVTVVKADGEKLHQLPTANGS